MIRDSRSRTAGSTADNPTDTFTVSRMDLLFSRPVVIALAILGAIASTLASALKDRIGAERAKQLNAAGYAFMGASILLFIIAGFRT